MSGFRDSYNTPEWRKRVAEIIELHGWRCDECGIAHRESPLTAHNRWYEMDRAAWEYPDEAFQALCRDCHREVTAICRELRRAVGMLSLPEKIRLSAHLRGFSQESPNNISGAIKQHLRVLREQARPPADENYFERRP